MIARRLLPVVLIFLLSIPFVPTFAQNGLYGTTYCGDLAEADCTLLTDSIAVMRSVTSATVDASITMHLVGDEIAEGVDDATITMRIVGPVEADFAGYYQFMEAYQNIFNELLENPSGLDMMTITSLKVYADLIDSLKGEVDIEMLVEPATDGLGSVSTSVVIADGIIYVDYETLVEQFPDEEPIDAAWVGIDLGELMNAEIGTTMQELDMLGGTTITEEDEAILNAMVESELLDLFYDEAFLSEFMTVERLADQEIDGQTIAVFETTTDFTEMLGSDTLIDAFYEFVVLAAAADPTAGEISLVEVELIFNLMAVVMPHAEYTTTLWIGTNDHYQYRSGLRVFLEMDLSMLGDPAMTEPIVIDLDVQVDIRDFNVPVEVEIPTDVEMLDPNELE